MSHAGKERERGRTYFAVLEESVQSLSRLISCATDSACMHASRSFRLASAEPIKAPYTSAPAPRTYSRMRKRHETKSRLPACILRLCEGVTSLLVTNSKVCPLPRTRRGAIPLSAHLHYLTCNQKLMGDVKPEAGAEGGAATHLQIKIKSQDGDSVEFKVKPTTKLQKVRYI